MKSFSKPSKSGAKYLGHGDFIYRHHEAPIFSEAVGSILKDSSGRIYLDMEAANGSASLGFDSTILTEAVEKVKKISAIPSFCETEIRREFARKLGSKIHTITGLSGKMAFDLGGAQGIELAIKVVKSNTKKSQLVVFEGGYHGRSVYTSQLSASHRYRSLMGDWRVPVVRLPYPEKRSDDGFKTVDEWRTAALSQVRRLLSTELSGVGLKGNNQDVAALIVEPILNAGGIVFPDKKYMEEVVKMFREIGALIVVDEVFCAQYRTGKIFGFQHFNFKPDIMVLSKSITNGIVPMSCVWARDPLMSEKNYKPGTHSCTFANNILALAVASVVFDRFENWKDRDKRIKNLEKSLSATIDKVVKRSKLVISGYAIGGVGRILFKKSIAGEVDDMAMVINKTRPFMGVNGLILASTGLSPDVLAINPPLNVSDEHLAIFDQLLIDTFEKAEKIYK